MAFSEFLTRLPDSFPRPAQALGVLIHQHQEEFWQYTKAFSYDPLIVWVRTLLSSEQCQIHQVDIARLLNTLWRCSCKSNVWWTLDLLWELVESPQLHTRLIRRILNSCLRNSIQYSEELYRIILACMNKYTVSATVAAEMLYIAWLRFDVNPDHYKYIARSKTLQMYMEKEAVLKAFARFLSPTMIYSLVHPVKRQSPLLQNLWKSKYVQEWYANLKPAIPILEAFLRKSIRRWGHFQSSASCCICMECRSGSMKPLHADLRHVVCKPCYAEMRKRPHVGCPVCRRSLLLFRPLHKN